ncbi:MAG TPA: class I SAM-dependent methyltransferase family protein [Candidatus Methanoperedens sp.]
MEGKLSKEKLSLVPNGFEVIGDIAVINILDSLNDEKYIIANTLVSYRKDVRSVLRKISKLGGSKRIGEFELLIGNSTETVHRENGCVFQVDIAKTYFSGKLAYERARIADSVRDGEEVLVLFAGAGPFLIPIKKKSNISITGLDNNPAACQYLRKNVLINNIDAHIILGDADSMCTLFKRSFDRIVMPAPYGQDYFLNLARPILKRNGMIHFYTFKKDFELAHFIKLLEEKGWHINFYRKCGGVAPRVNRYVFDLQRD